jgi:cation diffusion facilitator CzcD-associated flavoprotein CzcO
MALSAHHGAKSNRRRPPITVAVIGCGPGGMFFLHALATLRQKLQQDGDDEALAALPVVTVFERASSPGGVWKSSRSSAADAAGDDDVCPFKYNDDQATLQDDHISDATSNSSNNDTKAATNTNMYEGLWINGHNQAIEFSDYTFDDHFQRPLPIFLPRQFVLEYLLARVTSKEDIFQHVKFNTTVRYVEFKEALSKFAISTIKTGTGEESVGYYDKCIWAGGINGIPHFASNIKNLLLEQNFKGQVVHSSEMGSLASSVQGKRIMLIGDSYSAEDLALQCLKLGADKVYIASRSGVGLASNVVEWPGNRVEVLKGMLPCGVADDGKNVIICDSLGNEDERDEIEVMNVSIVIFCTGYDSNMDYLDPDLYRSSYETSWSVPDGWQMNNNSLSAIIGNVKPSTELYEASTYVTLGLYRHLLIRNPNMMFLHETGGMHPLLEIDVAAWLLLGYITGTVESATEHEMKRRNLEELLREMQELQLRVVIDPEFYYALDRLIPKNHWFYAKTSEEYRAYFEGILRYETRILAREMKDAGYPFSLGTYDKLNDAGEKMVRMSLAVLYARFQPKTDSEDIEWRTFRDIDTHGFSSFMTGTEAVPFPGRWMDLDDEGRVEANILEQNDLAYDCVIE